MDSYTCEGANRHRNRNYEGNGILKRPKETWLFVPENATSQAPVVADETIYIGCDDGKLYAIDTNTGNEKWLAEFDDSIFSVPAVEDGRVFLSGQDDHFYSLDAESGEIIWSLETENLSGCSPLAINGVVYFGDDRGFYAVESRTGQKKWEFMIEKQPLYLSPAFGERLVFVGNNKFFPCLYALDIENGEFVWRYPEKEDDFLESGVMSVGVPAFSDGILCVAVYGGSYIALDATKGKLLWEKDMNANAGDLYDPAISENLIFCNDGSRGSAYAIDLRSGEVIWKVEDLHRFFTGTTYIVGSPWVVEGLVYYPTNEGVVALDKKTGSKVWVIIKQTLQSEAVISDGALYFYARGKKTGLKAYRARKR